MAMIMVDGDRIEECELCGSLQGDDATVFVLEERREAEALGWQPELLGLVRAMESIPGLKAERVQPGDVSARIMPTIFFALTRGMKKQLEQAVASLTMAMRNTHHRWLLEITFQRHLVLVMRPRLFHAPLDTEPEEIERAIEDLAALRDALRRDMDLTWWNR